MKVLAFLLLFVLVFAGVAAYSLQQKGLLTRETLDLYLGEKPEEEVRTLIDIEPVGLAQSVWENEERMREQERRLELRSERLAAQRKELDAERAFVEKRIEKLRAEAERIAAEKDAGREAGSGAMLERETNVISEEMLQLVKMYESMPPDDAAAALDNMPDQTVAQVLLQMRGRQAAQIMAALEKQKATAVGTLLSVEDGVKKLPKPEPVAAP